MNILTDIHCHTIASVHAYSTVKELVQEAALKGLEAIAVTDHGMEMEDAPMEWHFSNLKTLPRKIEGVSVFRGCEANILDKTGRIDFAEATLKKLDIVIASIHGGYYYAKQGGDHTSTYLGVLENPYVDILGHSGNPNYAYDIDIIVKKAKELNKLIEINAHSFDVRKDNIKRCREIAKACKRIGTGIVVNSDAHICYEVGEVKRACDMLSDINFPEELIINRNLETLDKYLNARKKAKQ